MAARRGDVAGRRSLAFYQFLTANRQQTPHRLDLAPASGGDDYGERWHFSGTAAHKQRAVDDYVATAEWLVANGYTGRGRITAIAAGPSTAVVAAVINQRPGLIGAAALGSPILDLLRMTDLPGSRSWIPELGSIAQPSDYRALRAVSPYYDLEKSCYPALLVTAGERDDQAHLSHAYKYVAAVQHLETCDAPVHLEVRWGSGTRHWASTRRSDCVLLERPRDHSTDAVARFGRAVSAAMTRGRSKPRPPGGRDIL